MHESIVYNGQSDRGQRYTSFYSLTRHRSSDYDRFIATRHIIVVTAIIFLITTLSRSALCPIIWNLIHPIPVT